MPELASQRIRFAVLHLERFTSPPRVVLEHYPVLTLDANGNLDLELHQQQLQADVDRLEATDYAPIQEITEPNDFATTWHPDPAIRRRLIAATTPTYQTRMKTCSQPSRAEESRPRLSYGRAQWTAPRYSTSRIPPNRLHDRA